MEGHLRLTASRGATGETYLSRQSCAPPIHISKPHREAEWLVVNLASPTPGLFAGDRVSVQAELETGAHLLLTAPSASRLHTMKEGRAEWTQSFHLAAGSCLDVWPEYLIPQAGARYHQQTSIHLEPGATLLWTETIAPGRVARGEAYAFSELSFAADVFHGSRHLVRERYRWRPGEGMSALLRVFPTAYYASILAVHREPAIDRLAFASIHDLHDPQSGWIGITRLNAYAAAIKVVAADSPTLRATVAKIRATLQGWLAISSPSLRRITGSPTG